MTCSARSSASRRTASDTPCALKTSTAPSGTASTRSTNTAPRARLGDHMAVVHDLVVRAPARPRIERDSTISIARSTRHRSRVAGPAAPHGRIRAGWERRLVSEPRRRRSRWPAAPGPGPPVRVPAASATAARRAAQRGDGRTRQPGSARGRPSTSPGSPLTIGAPFSLLTPWWQVAQLTWPRHRRPEPRLRERLGQRQHVVLVEIAGPMRMPYHAVVARQRACAQSTTGPACLWQWVQLTPSDSLMWIIKPKLSSVCRIVAGSRRQRRGASTRIVWLADEEARQHVDVHRGQSGLHRRMVLAIGLGARPTGVAGRAGRTRPAPESARPDGRCSRSRRPAPRASASRR